MGRPQGAPSIWLRDYINGLLSVDYNVGNDSGFGAFGARIDTAAASGGVTMATGLLFGLGDIPGGGSAAFMLRYDLPVGASRFRASIIAGAGDACGARHTYLRQEPSPAGIPKVLDSPDPGGDHLPGAVGSAPLLLPAGICAFAHAAG